MILYSDPLQAVTLYTVIVSGLYDDTRRVKHSVNLIISYKCHASACQSIRNHCIKECRYPTTYATLFNEFYPRYSGLNL